MLFLSPFTYAMQEFMKHLKIELGGAEPFEKIVEEFWSMFHPEAQNEWSNAPSDREEIHKYIQQNFNIVID